MTAASRFSSTKLEMAATTPLRDCQVKEDGAVDVPSRIAGLAAKLARRNVVSRPLEIPTEGPKADRSP